MAIFHCFLLVHQRVPSGMSHQAEDFPIETTSIRRFFRFLPGAESIVRFAKEQHRKA